MRWLVNYFRQAFCRHDFEVKEHPYIINEYFGKTLGLMAIEHGITKLSTCEECGYTKRKKYKL